MKNVLVIRPKTVSVKCFAYTGIEDLPNLIKFVGVAPQINIDMSLTFNKKMKVKTGDIITVDTFGNVTKVLSPEEIKEKYDLVSAEDFTEKDANKIQEKPVKVAPEKGEGEKSKRGRKPKDDKK